MIIKTEQQTCIEWKILSWDHFSTKFYAVDGISMKMEADFEQCTDETEQHYG